LSFIIEEVIDVRSKIKMDFDLLDKFNGLKQTQAFNKIVQRNNDNTNVPVHLDDGTLNTHQEKVMQKP
jgi:hypothetical protein